MSHLTLIDFHAQQLIPELPAFSEYFNSTQLVFYFLGLLALPYLISRLGVLILIFP